MSLTLAVLKTTANFNSMPIFIGNIQGRIQDFLGEGASQAEMTYVQS